MVDDIRAFWNECPDLSAVDWQRLGFKRQSNGDWYAEVKKWPEPAQLNDQAPAGESNKVA